MSSKKKNHLLARVNFPPYTVASLAERHILVAGGGGGSKTGIPNVIEIYELTNNGSTCRAEPVTHYQTGNEAIMNCTVFKAEKYFILFAGKEGNCQVYKIKHAILDETNLAQNSENQNLILRKSKHTVSDQKDNVSTQNSHSNRIEADSNANVIHSRLGFKIIPLETFQTDFSDDPFQKLVKFSPIANILCTAGADGHLRLWKYPSFHKIHDIEAHSDDVDDLDICPLGKRIVTASRDGHAKIWNIETGSLICELHYTLPTSCNTRYIFRGCKFGVVEDKGLALFATLNPAVRKRPPLKCYICKWDATQYTLQKVVSLGSDMTSVMAVSDNGRFIGLGTQEGSVKIYIAFSLQLIYQANRIHGIFVTGLQFLPTCEESSRISGGHETSLISISVDNHISIHHIPVRDSFGIISLITFLILTLFIIFIIMDFLKL